MRRIATLVLTAAVGAACVSAKRPALTPRAPERGATLWERPVRLASQDLLHGPWGRDYAPDPDAVYTLVERKHSGVNLGMTVRDPEGREWSVKQPFPGGMDDEGQVEVVVSRLLSAIGYHQPPVYYLPTFTLQDEWGRHTEIGGRFRPKLEELDDKGSWRWEDNPFVGTRPYRGLLAVLMMFNSTDLKASNNTLYERRRGDVVERWYVARDLGSALGDTQRLAPRKGHIDSFERDPFIRGVADGYVDFHYNGWYRKLVDRHITADDVAWASELLAGLSERQWRDAFRAGGFEPAVASRFIAKLQEKIREGQSLGRQAGVTGSPDHRARR
jgi:hypothetical protein